LFVRDATAMEAQTQAQTKILACYAEAMREFVAMVKSATDTIYYSTFLCMPDQPIAGQNRSEPPVTLAELFSEAVARGVRVNILYNPEEAYGNLPPAEFAAKFPHNPLLRIRAVYGSGKLSPLTKLFAKNDRYTNHHQKYLCVDATRMMITGCDIDPDRRGWKELNSSGFYWHELAVSVPCTPEMFGFVHTNFEKIRDVPPLPLTSGKSEHDLLIRLIRTAQTHVHMEAQICVSSASTQNKVFHAVAERLKRAYMRPDADPFFFFFLTNTEQIDEPGVLSWIMKQDVLWSRRYLKAECGRRGVPWDFVRRRTFMGTLRCAEDGRHIKVHSNFLIQDGRVMLRSSSNLSDRSMSDAPCDTELGICIQDAPQAVQVLQNRLFSRYAEGDWAVSGAHAFYETIQSGTAPNCIVHPIVLTASPDETTAMPDGPVNALMDLTHMSKAFGGRMKVRWTVEDPTSVMNTIVHANDRELYNVRNHVGCLMTILNPEVGGRNFCPVEGMIYVGTTMWVVCILGILVCMLLSKNGLKTRTPVEGMLLVSGVLYWRQVIGNIM
jgi:phosphatidylserine/phosphatidylglycerophosphate/cardiolipin synthase-like enzyme